LFLVFFFYVSFFCGRFLFRFFFLFDFFGSEISLCFLFDFISVGFFICVSFISRLVYIYSVFYIYGTVSSRKFYFLVFSFVISIFILVFSGNFFLLVVGWDGLGLSSFCLVIFYNNSSSLDSGLITVFRNRLGDVFFLISLFLFFFRGGWIFDGVGGILRGLLGIFIFFGSITKRAQIPFSAWLPAAMAAPTPVSSLVHSSTLVTAGLYVVIRFNTIFFFIGLSFFIGVSLFTMLLAGAGALIEKDFKKVVALSTLRQLGFILFVICVGNWKLAFVHLIIHAFFKRMLFLRTGSLIRRIIRRQDSRFYGGNLISFASILFFFVSCLCLSGFPFFIGFYSKDSILCLNFLVRGYFLYLFFWSSLFIHG